MFHDDYDLDKRGTPRVVMHLVAQTQECLCPRLPGCGGIEAASVHCPEHGMEIQICRFHTHAQQVNQINEGSQRVR